MADFRLSYVDTAKFLAIWFVIISHSCMKSGICFFLFAFHVQLFFMLYGYEHKTKREQSLIQYLIVGGENAVLQGVSSVFSTCIYIRCSNFPKFHCSYSVWKYSIIGFYNINSSLVSSLLFCGSFIIQFAINSLREGQMVNACRSCNIDNNLCLFQQ